MNLRPALRSLWRDRAFALTVILVLGLGIGVNNVFFTLVYGFKLRGLPIASSDRLLYISTFEDGVPDRGMSAMDLADLRTTQQSFTGLAAFINGPVTVGDEGRAADRFDASYVSGNAFEVLGVVPAIGRPISDADDRPAAAAAVMLGSGVWWSRYDSDPAILGRTILVNGTPATVIGVVPEQSGFPSTAAVFLPLHRMPGLVVDRRDARTLRVFGRLRDGVAVASARTEAQSILDQLARAYPQTNGTIRARVVTIDERLLGTLEGWGAFIAAGFIIVIVACANGANLMLARAAHRAPELAMRTALGASRRRIVGELLLECGILAALGGCAGLALSIAGTRAVRAMVPAYVLPYWVDFSMDRGIFLALVVVSAATVLVFGLVPAIRASRSDVNQLLKTGVRTGGGRLFRGWTTAFLSAQLALAILLVAHVGAANLHRETRLPTDAALDNPDVLTGTLTLPADAYPTPERRADFYRRLEERLHARDASASAALTSTLPMTGAPERGLEVRGQPPADGRDRRRVMTAEIGPAYFQTLQLSVTRGRAFSADDRAGVAIVNERLAELFFPGQDPLGKQIGLTAPNGDATSLAWLTIVGIAPTIRQRPSPDPLPVAYLPILASAPATTVLMLRAPGGPAASAPFLRSEVQALDRNVPIYRTQSLTGAIADANWNGRVGARIALSLTCLTIVLATVGLYAVVAWSVTQRRREIGIRMALGARPRQVVQSIVRAVRLPLVLGIALGLAGSLAWERAFTVERAGLLPAPFVVLVVVTCVAAMAIAACVFPARRAAKLNPATALRLE